MYYIEAIRRQGLLFDVPALETPMFLHRLYLLDLQVTREG
jgi:hypothetical protein